MKYIIKIDRSSIKLNPDGGKSIFYVAGQQHLYIDGEEVFCSDENRKVLIENSLKDGKVVKLAQDCNPIHLLSPLSKYLYNYEPTNVKCEDCGEQFDYKELRYDEFYDDDYGSRWSDKICPKCWFWDCCELEFEKIDKVCPN